MNVLPIVLSLPVPTQEGFGSVQGSVRGARDAVSSVTCTRSSRNASRKEPQTFRSASLVRAQPSQMG